MISRYSREENLAAFEGVGGLGFSLKPPKWVRDAAKKVQQRIPKGTTVNVDLGTGSPISVDLSDPTSIAALRKQFENAKLTLTGPKPAQVVEPPRFPSFTSGSGSNIMLIGAVVVAAMFLMRKR